MKLRWTSLGRAAPSGLLLVFACQHAPAALPNEGAHVIAPVEAQVDAASGPAAPASASRPQPPPAEATPARGAPVDPPVPSPDGEPGLTMSAGVDPSSGFTVQGAGARDLATPPRVAGPWSCEYPKEADNVGIDDATVTLRVHVSADGRATSVEILQDPGHGFGNSAKACALRNRYTPGKDPAGAPVEKALVARVRFIRS